MLCYRAINKLLICLNKNNLLIYLYAYLIYLMDRSDVQAVENPNSRGNLQMPSNEIDDQRH